MEPLHCCRLRVLQWHCDESMEEERKLVANRALVRQTREWTAAGLMQQHNAKSRDRGWLIEVIMSTIFGLTLPHFRTPFSHYLGTQPYSAHQGVSLRHRNIVPKRPYPLFNFVITHLSPGKSTDPTSLSSKGSHKTNEGRLLLQRPQTTATKVFCPTVDGALAFSLRKTLK